MLDPEKEKAHREKMRQRDELIREYNVKCQQAFDKIREEAEGLAVPCLQLIKISQESASGFSKIGGLPDVQPGFQWPYWKVCPLAFLAQIQLTKIPRCVSNSFLPKEGILYFFYTVDQKTWGFDPKDKGSWRVIYNPGESGLVRAEAPSGLEEKPFPEFKVEFKERLSFPEEHPKNWNEYESMGYCQYREYQKGEMPLHQLGGSPFNIQGEMTLECQLASNGIYCGDAEGYKSNEAKKLAAGARDWKLLLQIDSDFDLKMMWGDLGMLYFWCKEEDVKKGDFDGVWMILQCG